MNIEQQKQIDNLVEEWESVGNGQKTVPLIQIASTKSEIEKERAIFKYIAKKLKNIFKNE